MRSRVASPPPKPYKLESTSAENIVTDSSGNAADVVFGSALDVDFALEHAGGFGLAQICAIAVLGFAYGLCAWGFYIPGVHGGSADREITFCNRQVLPDGSTCTAGELLSDNFGCDDDDVAWRYVNSLRFVTAEWDLSCARRGHRTVIGTVYLAGSVLGHVLFARVSNAKGRCVAFCIASFVIAAGYALCGLTASFNMYLLGQSVGGLACAGLVNICFVWASEMLPRNHRSRAGILNLVFCFGTIAFVCFDLLLPQWRALTLFYSLLFACCGVLGLVARHHGLESPAWLASRGDAAGVQRVAATLASFNGVNYAPVAAGRESSAVTGAMSASKQASPESLASMRWEVCAISMGYMASKLGYLGLSMGGSSLGFGFHISTSLLALVEVPAVAGSQVCMNFPVLGRRGTVFLGLIGTVACCLLSCCVSTPSAVLAVNLFGKMLISGTFNTIMVYATETFPVTVRSPAMAICGTAANVASVAAPSLLALPGHWPAVALGTTTALLAWPIVTLTETLEVGKAKEE
eukprot:TRINITY_DN5276_c0_g1_i6.p1 TRINITY_DN5276_c0_g1~~TRINITY_DN5276_c0_g1_i6.p1  ORF type:complete len:521 (-),score=54.68 TRINITY_DN5276_c0_g1_i6:260-1822(-)